MAEAKKTAKKAAAPRKRAAAKAKAEVAPDQSTVYAPERGVYAFPLEEGDYFSVPVTSRRSTSRGAGVHRIKRALNLRLDTAYDEEMADAVGAFQQEHDLPVTRVVDKATWDAIFSV
jgi:peptidoglycan hydrolase-like protein with peptidoglycan-binding domain